MLRRHCSSTESRCLHIEFDPTQQSCHKAKGIPEGERSGLNYRVSKRQTCMLYELPRRAENQLCNICPTRLWDGTIDTSLPRVHETIPFTRIVANFKPLRSFATGLALRGSSWRTAMRAIDAHRAIEALDHIDWSSSSPTMRVKNLTICRPDSLPTRGSNSSRLMLATSRTFLVSR